MVLKMVQEQVSIKQKTNIITFREMVKAGAMASVSGEMSNANQVLF